MLTDATVQAVSNSLMALSAAIVAKSVIASIFKPSSKVNSEHADDGRQALELVKQCCKTIVEVRKKQTQGAAMLHAITTKQNALDENVDGLGREHRDINNTLGNISNSVDSHNSALSDIKSELAVIKDRNGRS